MRVLAVCALAVLCAHCAAILPKSQDVASSLRSAAPDFALPDLRGQVVTLSEHVERRRVIVLSFWATWCTPCNTELKALHDLYGRYKPQGLEVLAINEDGPDSEAEVNPFVSKYGYDFPVLSDGDGRVLALFNPKGSLPFSVIIGRSGKVERLRQGFSAGEQHALEQEIRALLQLEEIQ